MFGGPYSENDTQFVQKTKDIIEHFGKDFPGSKYILKMYPTVRYLETYEFGNYLKQNKNLQIIKNLDFRFIRAAADVLLITSWQSTLGWALGTEKPCIFYEFDWSPVSFAGFESGKGKIDNCRSVKLLFNTTDLMEPRKTKRIFKTLLK